MKAVVMAGGEGTRLRPLTSNQPKPMVPIVGKPCMEHILELLQAARPRGGDRDRRVHAAGDPQLLRQRRQRWECTIEYSVEESPLGTAGSVRLASDRLDETFLVISGDALCDVDLTDLIRLPPREGRGGHDRAEVGREPARVRDRRHRRGGADRAFPREAFLEPGLLGHDQHGHLRARARGAAPHPDRPAVRLLEGAVPAPARDGPPAVRHVFDGYWQDIGNLDQFRQANFDALDERVRLNISGHPPARQHLAGGGGGGRRPRRDRGPGLPRQLLPHRTRRVGRRLLGARLERDAARASADRALRDRRGDAHRPQRARRGSRRRARLRHPRPRARPARAPRSATRSTLGAQSAVLPGVRIYPYKEVETGAQIHESLIWESRASSNLFGKEGVSGLVNVDLTPETAVRLAAALGTALKRGARVVASRESPGSVPDDQAGDDLRPQLDRRGRRRPARPPGLGQPPPAEDAGLRRRASTSASATPTRRCSRSASTSSRASS